MKLKFLVFALAIASYLPTIAFAQFSQPVRDIENPARTPYNVLYSCTELSNSGVSCDIASANIPAGYRMVVETVTGRILMSGTTNAPYFSLDTGLTGPLTFQMDSQPYTAGNSRAQLHVQTKFYINTFPASFGMGSINILSPQPPPGISRYINFIGYLLKL